ncbi:MAG: FAD-dependent monooxygenase [Lautropia sp.]
MKHHEPTIGDPDAPVLIAGGGIGGLTLALALHRAGIACIVYEVVAEPRPLGVGINLMPSAVKILVELGLQPFFDDVAVEPSRLRYANKFGQLVWEEPRGRAAGYDYPQLSVHRGKLQILLLEEVRRRLGERSFVGGKRVARYANADRAVRVFFDDSGTASGRALVGCDGLHSAVRRQMVPDEGAPRESGRILWRAVTRARPFLDGRTMLTAGHEYQKFVCYPLSRTDADGTSLLNWVVRLHWPAGETRPAWTHDMTPARLAAVFARWNFGWLDVPDVIANAQFLQEHPMADRDPLDRWTDGRVTLLGDAAHPMYPIGSNGATQAIIDAHALAAALAREPDAERALQTYERLRRDAANAVVLANRRNGPDQVLQLAEDRAPQGFARIEDVITREELAQCTASYQRIAGFTREAVNQEVRA